MWKSSWRACGLGFAIWLVAGTASAQVILDTEQVRDALERGVQVWDVRPDKDFVRAHLPGALSAGDAAKALREPNSEDFLPTEEVARILGEAGIVLAVEFGNRIRYCTAESSANGLGNGLVAVVLLHPGGGGIQHLVLALPKDHLRDHRQGQHVGTGTGLDESKHGRCSVPKIVHQTAQQTRSNVIRRFLIPLGPFLRCGPEQQRNQIRLPFAHVEHMTADGTPDRPGIQQSGRNRWVAIWRGVFHQRLCDGRFTDRAI